MNKESCLTHTMKERNRIRIQYNSPPTRNEYMQQRQSECIHTCKKKIYIVRQRVVLKEAQEKTTSKCMFVQYTHTHIT